MTAITFTVYALTLSQNFAGADTTEKREAFAFILLCTMQLVQSFLSRSITNSVFVTGITGNRVLVFAFFLSYGLLLLGLEVPAIAHWLELTDPGGAAWGIVWICVVIQVVCVEAMKWVLRRYFMAAASPQSLASESSIPMVVQISTDRLAPPSH
ncbi:hypothetical protein HDU91_000909 [Kappamyces sp. JEL0680]|nr:hypothetical protein HDU91_000909 [Kappamyces sp. JEL0680]